jgi:hypothetical protein
MKRKVKTSSAPKQKRTKISVTRSHLLHALRERARIDIYGRGKNEILIENEDDHIELLSTFQVVDEGKRITDMDELEDHVMAVGSDGTGLRIIDIRNGQPTFLRVVAEQYTEIENIRRVDDNTIIFSALHSTRDNRIYIVVLDWRKDIVVNSLITYYTVLHLAVINETFLLYEIEDHIVLCDMTHKRFKKIVDFKKTSHERVLYIDILEDGTISVIDNTGVANWNIMSTKKPIWTDSRLLDSLEMGHEKRICFNPGELVLQNTATNTVLKRVDLGLTFFHCFKMLSSNVAALISEEDVHLVDIEKEKNIQVLATGPFNGIKSFKHSFSFMTWNESVVKYWRIPWWAVEIILDPLQKKLHQILKSDHFCDAFVCCVKQELVLYA